MVTREDVGCHLPFSFKLHYDLRLSGKQPRLLLITTRLMAAYDISDDVLTSGCQSSPLKLHAVWKYIPKDVSFGRILRVFRESAIVTLYEGKIRFVYPEIDNSEPNAKTMATYEVCDRILFPRQKGVFTDIIVLSSRPRHRTVPNSRQYLPHSEYSGLYLFPVHCLPQWVRNISSKQR